MAITIDWATKIISVPQADLDLIGGTLYELDTDEFRLALKSIEDSEEGMPFPDTHRHNTEVTVAGVTYARTIEIINGYSVEFENGQYTVKLVGSNNNIFDVENGILQQNYVQIIPTNAAGLITVVQGSGVTEQDKTDIATAVWADTSADLILKTLKNKKELKKNGSVWELIIYDDDDSTPILNKELKDRYGNNISDFVAGTLAMELKSSV